MNFNLEMLVIEQLYTKFDTISASVRSQQFELWRFAIGDATPTIELMSEFLAKQASSWELRDWVAVMKITPENV